MQLKWCFTIFKYVYLNLYDYDILTGLLERYNYITSGTYLQVLWGNLKRLCISLVLPITILLFPLLLVQKKSIGILGFLKYCVFIIGHLIRLCILPKICQLM